MGCLKPVVFLPLTPTRSGFHPLRLMGQLVGINPKSSNALRFLYVRLQTLTEPIDPFLFCPASIAYTGAKETERLHSHTCIAQVHYMGPPCAAGKGEPQTGPGSSYWDQYKELVIHSV